MYRILYVPAFDGYIAQTRSGLFSWNCIRSDFISRGEESGSLSTARLFPSLYKCSTIEEAKNVIEINKNLNKKEKVVWSGD